MLSSLPNYTAFVTLLAVALYFSTGLMVAKARQKFGVVLPATTGHTDFERVFRVQQNTLEWMPIFLPSLWLFALSISDLGGMITGKTCTSLRFRVGTAEPALELARSIFRRKW